MSCLPNVGGHRIVRKAVDLQVTIHDGEVIYEDWQEFEPPTKTFRVLAVRGSLMSTSAVVPFGFMSELSIAFLLDGTGMDVQNVVFMQVSEVFKSSETFVFYNFENMIMSGVNTVQLSARSRAVNGEVMNSDVTIDLRIELFYEPIRY